jgi:hypothetical protein
MFSLVSLIIFIVAFFTGVVVAAGFFSDLKHENERLNKELHVLTDRDERGRFKGGK